ncbi:MAG TPA: dienelactone hydrolase family protein [Xanthomonadaceae bacterium]|nr:dienelactone hydrolase family protein [Xanthomonadaceae bacterium]
MNRTDPNGKGVERIEPRFFRLPPLGLDGVLRLPPSPVGTVVFAHGSGSSRTSRRNNRVAEFLGASSIATLLFDLLDASEALDRHNVFDISLLAGRLEDAIEWVMHDEHQASLPIGLFGASTGAAAALVAAVAYPKDIAALVSRGGRPDLAGDALPEVRAPTLLIVGGHDHQVLELNRQARVRMRCETDLQIVPGATHLFEEPGALEAVAQLSRDWFLRHFSAQRMAAR